MRKQEGRIMIRRDEPLAESSPIWMFEMHMKSGRVKGHDEGIRGLGCFGASNYIDMTVRWKWWRDP